MSGNAHLTRRTFLRKTGVGAAAVLGGTVWATSPAAARARRRAKQPPPIRHLVVSCQENRSFDHYFGYAPAVQARGFGPPTGYTQPDALGDGHAAFELTALRSGDPPHGWNDVHAQVDGGRMNGFHTRAQERAGDGNLAIGYYTARELPFYYSLFPTAGCAPTTSARC
jgi:phospholipase C